MYDVIQSYVSTHACVPPTHSLRLSGYPAAMSVTGETVECDASTFKYSYSAIFEYALYTLDVSKEYQRLYIYI